MLSSLVWTYLHLNQFLFISVYQHHLFESTVNHWGPNSAVTRSLFLSLWLHNHKLNNCCCLIIWQLETFIRSIFTWMHVLSLSEYQLGNWQITYSSWSPWSFISVSSVVITVSHLHAPYLAFLCPQVKNMAPSVAWWSINLVLDLVILVFTLWHKSGKLLTLENFKAIPNDSSHWAFSHNLVSLRAFQPVPL